MSNIYSGGSVAGLCVYLLRDKDGHVRYVGQGKLSRVEKSACSMCLSYELAAVNLGRDEALAIEARLIHLIGPERLRNVAIPEWPNVAAGARRFLVSKRYGLGAAIIAKKPINRLLIDPARDRRRRLTELAVLEILAANSDGRTRLALSEKFGVSISAVAEVQRRRSWAHLTAATTLEMPS